MAVCLWAVTAASVGNGVADERAAWAVVGDAVVGADDHRRRPPRRRPPRRDDHHDRRRAVGHRTPDDGRRHLLRRASVPHRSSTTIRCPGPRTCGPVAPLPRQGGSSSRPSAWTSTSTKGASSPRSTSGRATCLTPRSPGFNGDTVFAGHRVTYTHPFQHLDRLVPGDTVTFVMPWHLHLRVDAPRSSARGARRSSCRPPGRRRRCSPATRPARRRTASSPASTSCPPLRRSRRRRWTTHRSTTRPRRAGRQPPAPEHHADDRRPEQDHPPGPQVGRKSGATVRGSTTDSRSDAEATWPRSRRSRTRSLPRPRSSGPTSRVLVADSRRGVGFAGYGAFRDTPSGPATASVEHTIHVRDPTGARRRPR